MRSRADNRERKGGKKIRKRGRKGGLWLGNTNVTNV